MSSRRGARENFVTHWIRSAFKRDKQVNAVAADLWAARRSCVSKTNVALRRAKRLQLVDRFANIFHCDVG